MIFWQSLKKLVLLKSIALVGCGLCKYLVFLLVSDKQKENEKLRESLSKKNAIIEHLHEDYECIKRENERLQKQIGQKEDETRYLTCQIYSSRNELNRY